jgi:hypothetical protein
MQRQEPQQEPAERGNSGNGAVPLCAYAGDKKTDADRHAGDQAQSAIPPGIHGKATGLFLCFHTHVIV